MNKESPGPTPASNTHKIRVFEACRDSLIWFRQNARINEEGNRSIELETWSVFLQSMVAEEILVDCISIQPEIPERTKRRAVSRAITRWLKHKKYVRNPDVLAGFESALKIEIRSLEKSRKEYNILLFLNLKPNSFYPISPLNVQGYQVAFVPWDELGAFDLASLWRASQRYCQITGQKLPVFAEEEDGYYPLPTIYTPVIIALHSYNPQDALSVAVEQIDLFRAAFNFDPATRMFIKHGSDSYPISKFLPSPVYGVFSEQGKLLYNAYTVESSKCPRRYIVPENVTQQDVEAAMNLIEKINAGGNGLLSLFVKLLYLYQQALDFTEPRAAFLGLWRVVEATMLDDPSYRVSVERHLGKLIGVDREPVLKQALSVFARRRNELVHSGAFPDWATNLVFALKKLVDYALFEVLELSAVLSDENEFREYLNHITKNDIDLARQKKVIELIQFTRKGN